MGLQLQELPRMPVERIRTMESFDVAHMVSPSPTTESRTPMTLDQESNQMLVPDRSKICLGVQSQCTHIVWGLGANHTIIAGDPGEIHQVH